MRLRGVRGAWTLLLVALVSLAGTPALLVAAAGTPTFVAASGSPFATGGTAPEEITANPAGTRLYVTNNISNNVTVFTLDGSGNVTGQQPGSPFATGGSFPFGVAINPAGTRLYVTNTASNTVTVFTLDATGNVTGPQPGSPFATGGIDPEGVATNPAGTRLYVANNSGTVTVFTLDGSGNITGQQPGSPVASGGSIPRMITTNPSGTRLYATNNTSNTVTVFTLDASGNITAPQAGSPFATGVNPFAVAINPAGTRLYVINASPSSNTVTVLTLDASGNITGMQPGSPFPSGGTVPVGVATGDFDGDGNPDLAVTNESGSVTLLAADASGNLTGSMPSTGLTVGSGPFGIIARDLNGDDRPDLVVVNSSGSISVLFTTPAHAITTTQGTAQSTITGSAFATPLVATLTDLNNAPMAGTHVTFTVQPGGTGAAATFASAAGCVLSGGNLIATCLTAVTGTVTAPPLTANTHAGSFTVTANLPNNTLSAATFTLTNRTATLTVAGYPFPTSAGTPNPFTLTVIDQTNHVGTTYTGTVQFTSTDPTATLPAAYTFTAADAGLHTFSATFGSVGTWTLTATDTVVGTITGQQAAITVDPATTTTALMISPSPAVHGTPVTLTARVAPAMSTTLPTPTGSVTFMDGGTPLGTVTLVSGTATLTTSALTAGMHQITATYNPPSGGAYATSQGTGEVTITAAALVSITVTPASATVKAGQVQQDTATGTYADSSTADLTSTVTWSSDVTTVARVDTSGKVTGQSPGTAHITASMGSVSGQASVTVSAGTAIGIAPGVAPGSRPGGASVPPAPGAAPAPAPTGR